MGASVARKLRRNASEAENRLWYVLRNRQVSGAKFVRQFPIGPYVADFACRSALLIVELDGGQHNGSVADVKRTAELARLGYTVLRFWNNDLMSNRDGVVFAITEVLAGRVPDGVRFEAGLSVPRAQRAVTLEDRGSPSAQ